ncbi:putative CocE/NonD family hydrolase [Chryseobacterium sp. H1D6B]|uniref:CocE/NonD family hydrolase n=1 Tax=Chryseobacterium sp. H1D6B TaxID=2940588 RepID=UPI0015C86C86|nr:CocE/NonD family hydrolase [Chryseobacterium sp. H1D6B]MDH6252210.1 putative CocE/NonD family hydrolase [Chryseobacterium sp. H1D6B]
MKKFCIIYFILCLNFIFSQKISLKEIGGNLKTESLVKYLAKELAVKYKEKDIAAYYDNMFRINMINENYDVSLSQLDSVRNVYKKSNPGAASAMGSQFEIYINTVKRTRDNKIFDKIYEEEFRKKYEKLPLESQMILPQYFDTSAVNFDKEINEMVRESAGKESIDIVDALKICRKYNSYNVAKKSFGLALPLLKKLEKEIFTVYDSIKINTKDNGIVTLSVVLNNKKKGKQSTILINTIYSGADNLNTAKEFAANGYAAVILNTRGKYLSPDNIEPFEHEADDIYDAIDWITRQTWSNGRVGMIGGSYLGFSQWAATKKMHPGLKTIIPQAAVGIGTMDYPMTNNVFMSYSLRWLNYVMNNKMTDDAGFEDTKNWNSVYKKWYESGRSFRKLDSISGKPNAVFQRWLDHPSYDAFWKKMIPYKKEFSKIDIPVLTTTGYYDADKLGALYYFREHYKYNKNASHYLIIGPYDHSGAQGYIKGEFRGYTIDPAAKINLNKIWLEWFDYILEQKDKPLFLKDKVNYQVMGTDQWKNAASIDIFDHNKSRFYIGNNEKSLYLSEIKLDKNKFAALKVNLADRTDADEMLNQKNNIVDNVLYSKNNLIFSSGILDKSFEFSGNFSGALSLSVNKKDVDLYINLFELMPDGRYFLISNYIARASYAKDNEKRNLLPENKKIAIPINNNDFVSRKMEKGSRLVLMIGVIKTPFWQINYGSGKDVSSETIADAKEPMEVHFYNDSYIDIPLIQK